MIVIGERDSKDIQGGIWNYRSGNDRLRDVIIVDVADPKRNADLQKRLREAIK